MKKTNIRSILTLLAAPALLLAGCAESTEDVVSGSTKPQDAPSNGITFAIDMAQDWNANNPSTRRSMQRAMPRNLQMTASDGTILQLQSTTVPGIDEKITPNAGNPGLRRAIPLTEVSQMSNFSDFCYTVDDQTLYFNNLSVGTDGATGKKWPEQKTLRCYAIHPYAESGITPAFNGPAYQFTVNSDVTQQVDLMFASSGDVAFNSNYLVPLHFMHALTAVKFKMGNAVPAAFGNYKIKSITLKNVYTKGKLTLPSAQTSASSDYNIAAWSDLGTQADIKLDNISFTPSANAAITPEAFMMIPQDLDGVSVEIELNDSRYDASSMQYVNTKLTASIAADAPWEAGTTRTYTLGATNEQYQLTVTAMGKGFSADNALAYNETLTDDILVQSFRYKEDKTQQEPVAWSITKYEYSDDNGATWTDNGTTKPSWLVSLTDQSAGSVSNENIGNATVAEGDIEYPRAERDALLKAGTVRTDWDLSTHDAYGNETTMNTANCYVISGPGTYKLPLVYGNAITNGQTNTNSFISNASGSNVLKNFIDYKGNAISDGGDGAPWIKNTNSENVPTSAVFIGSDVSEGVVANPAISGDYLTFEITDEIKAGNAVVAVLDAAGVMMWSWHLWFAPASVLDEIPCTISEGVITTYATEPVGHIPCAERTSYLFPRQIRVTVTQETSGETAQFVIFQNEYITKGEAVSFTYGNHNARLTSVTYNYGGYSLFNGSSPGYLNLFSANETLERSTNNIPLYQPLVKTVYDPSPAGFTVPSHGAIANIHPTTRFHNNDGGCYYPTDSDKLLFVPLTSTPGYYSWAQVRTERIAWWNAYDATSVAAGISGTGPYVGSAAVFPVKEK